MPNPSPPCGDIEIVKMNEKPVIIKLHPNPEEYVEAETAFLRAVGLCITQWAFVDRQLFRLFRFGIGASTHRAAIVYYDQHSIGRRLSQVDDLLKSAFEHPDNKGYLEEWQRLQVRTKELLPTRNIVAHQPVRRLGTSDGKKAEYLYGIYLEPYQKFLKKNVKGLGGKDALETDDLIKHSLEVVALEDDLKAFVRKIVHASSGD
jgi:hypothetical protein